MAAKKKIDLPKGSEGRVLTAEPVVVITTVDGQGRVNAASYGSYVRIAPQIHLAIARRHHTRENILETGELVINVPGVDTLESIMICGRKYPKGRNNESR